MWPVALSGRLPVVALVSHYLTNKLIGREPIPDRKTFHTIPMRASVVSGISSGFPGLFQSLGQVAHVLLTRSPLITQEQALKITVRLACVKHAASVRPEPGSNSPLMFKHHEPPKGPAAITEPKKGSSHRLKSNNQQKTDHSLSNQRIFVRSDHPPGQQTRQAATPRRGNWHRFLTRC